jgi:fibronectin type 3 domain-containing protein
MRLLLALLFLVPLLPAQSPSVQLSWSSGAAGTFNVYRSPAPCGVQWRVIGQTPSLNYSDMTVNPGQVYSYAVTVTVNGVESIKSNCVTFAIPTALPAPPPAPVLTGTITPN